MEKYGQIWTNLNTYGQIWTNMHKYDHTLTNMDKYANMGIIHTSLNKHDFLDRHIHICRPIYIVCFCCERIYTNEAYREDKHDCTEKSYSFSLHIFRLLLDSGTEPSKL